MPVTLEQFVQHLTQSGLMSATEVSSFQDTLPPDKRPKDAETLARQLVQANKLTKYQAQMVYQGKEKGLVFGEYVVLDKLGQGGMGVVLKAQHRRMDRIVAVKMIAGAALKSPDAVKRFYREVKTAAKLEHANIVTAHDASEYEGVHYLVMQFVDGKDLGAIVKEKGPLPIAQAVDCIVQAARGLQYAHDQGIIHRDIKPANLLVDSKGTVKILDMGLARIAGLVDEEDKDRLTASGQVMGTCDYMAPEQALDTHHADARADIYSLGCTLYRLVAGDSMYKGDTLAKILIAHQLSPIPSLCKVRSEVSPQLDAVFQKMVAKKPEARYQTMAEVIAELEACIGKRSGTEQSLSGQSRDSEDQAMKEALSFLEQASPRSTATASKKKVASHAEATFTQQAAAETSKQLGSDENPLAVAWRKRRLAIAIGLAVPSFLAIVFFAIMIRVRHPDGKETVVRVPEGSKVTVSKTGDVDVTVVAKKETPTTASDSPKAPSPAVAPFDAKKAKGHQEAWAKYLAVPVTETNSIGMKLVLIPPGEFDMGSTPEEIACALEEGKKKTPGDKYYFDRVPAEGPRHRVKITKPFYFGVYHVTQGEYENVRGVNPSAFAEKSIKASEFKPPLDQKQIEEREKDCERIAGTETSRHPVDMVNWDDAVEFCRRLSALPDERAAKRAYRLPTEAEWEYACRAGTTTSWYCGDGEVELTNVAWFTKNAGWMTHPVGEKRPNAWGLYDMHGNVNQWCSDWFSPDYYQQSPPNDPSGPPTASSRVLRGGYWTGYPFCCRSASRNYGRPVSRSHANGFRVVCEIAPKAQPGTDAGWQNAINLLPLIDPREDAVLGNWSKTSDGIAMERAKAATVLRLPYLPPEEYDFEIEFTPQGSGYNINQYIAAAGRSFAWKLNSHGKSPPLYGFELLDGKFAKDLDEAAVHKPKMMESGKRYTSRVEVRRGSVRAIVDGEEYVKWSGDFHRFSMEPITRLNEDGWIGIGSYSRGAVFHRIEVREVTGKGTFTRGVAKASAVDDAFIKEVAALPAEEQVNRIAAELQRLNPGFDGKLTREFWGGTGGRLIVGRLGFNTQAVSDIAPLRALRSLQFLGMGPGPNARGLLSDLSPLQGLPLTELACTDNPVRDISPLKGMPLRHLTLNNTLVEDLSPLSALPLNVLRLSMTPASDLSPLKGLRLTTLNISGTRVTSLEPLRGMPLEELLAGGSTVSDLTPLKGMPLRLLYVDFTRVGELSALRGLPLRELNCSFDLARDADTLRAINTLEKINGLPVADFWRQVESGATPSPWTNIRKAADEDESSAPTAIDPAFVKEVAALPPEQQVARVVGKLKELNPGYDGKEEHEIENDNVVEMKIPNNSIKDISPLQALVDLKRLDCGGKRSSQGQQFSPLRELAPLKGLALEVLNCSISAIEDLSSLQEMPLKNLYFHKTQVRDLSPLRALSLNHVKCFGTNATDLSPLRGQPLKSLSCDFDPKRDTEILRSIKTLETINGLPTAEFWKQVQAGKVPSPYISLGRTSAVGESSVQDYPAVDDAFIKEVAALPPEQQVVRVMAKLAELNPTFNPAEAEERHEIENGAVTLLAFRSFNVTDISPVRALAKLRTLSCGAASGKYSPLADLSPLRGLRLSKLVCYGTRVSDLSPLTDMPLTELELAHNPIEDLSPLKGMALTALQVQQTRVRDLSPLRGMPLEDFRCYHNKEVSDLSALRGSPLRLLACFDTSVRDLSLLKGATLADLRCDPAAAAASGNREVLTAIQTLKKINDLPVAEFWKQVDAGVLPKARLSIAKPTDKPDDVADDSALKQLGKVYKNAVGAEMVYIPPGEFMMGSTKDERAWAAQKIKMKDDSIKNEGDSPRKATVRDGFWMGRTEVTVGQWKEFVAATNYRTDAEKNGRLDYGGRKGDAWEKGADGLDWRDPGFGSPPAENHAVCCISWNDAVAFCGWLTEQERKQGRLPSGFALRLPTEAEWEYACRAGTQTKFWWGESEQDGRERSNDWGKTKDGHEFVAPVDSFGERGRNTFGLADLLGNVGEWCLDEHDWKGAHPEFSKGGSGERVLRGGSFIGASPGIPRCAARVHRRPSTTESHNGFRVCLGPDVLGSAAVAVTSPESRVTSAAENWQDWMAQQRRTGRIPGDFKDDGGAWVKTKPGGLTRLAYFMRDGAARVTFTLPDREEATIALDLRWATDGGTYQCAVMRQSLFLYLAEPVTSGQSESLSRDLRSLKTLRSWPLPASVEPNQEITLEFRAVGEELSVKVNDQFMGTVRDSTYSREGEVGFWCKEAGTRVSRIEILDLDGASTSALRTPQTALPGSVFTSAVGAEMVYIPPGEFMMGSTKEERAWAKANGEEHQDAGQEGEQPRKTAIRQGFWMGRTEVTVGQWKPFVEATGYVTTAEKKGHIYAYDQGKKRWGDVVGVSWKDPKFGEKTADNHPVVAITWNEAVAYCDWLNEREQKAGRVPSGFKVRLPTEAEWEYACRAGTRTRFWWGDAREDGANRVNWLGSGDGFEFTSPVDHYGALGRNGFGLADMLGNVWEWCLDGFDATQAHSECYKGNSSVRVLRGGAFYPGNVRCRSAFRIRGSTSSAGVLYGFRVCLGPDVLGSATTAVSSAPPVITNWQDVMPAVRDQMDKKGAARHEDGWAVLTQNLGGGISICNQPLGDIAVRGRFRNECQIQLTVSGVPSKFYNASLRRKAGNFLLSRYVGTKDNKTLENQPLGTLRYSSADEHDFLITKVGDLLSAWVDGAFAGSARDATFTRGTAFLYLQHPGDAIRDLAIADLSAAASADDAFIKEVAALPAEQQVKRVVAELKRLNPDFDPGTVKYEIGGRQEVYAFEFCSSGVTNMAPVRALAQLGRLGCSGSKEGKRSPLQDLSPLLGMRLKHLFCQNSEVADLSPLRGMPLESLSCFNTRAGDLAPLQGMPLKGLNCMSSGVGDLTPLSTTRQLETLVLHGNRTVRDLTPLRGLSLKSLSISATGVSDLSPLAGMPLEKITCDPDVAAQPANKAILRSIKTLRTINDLPVVEFWKQVDSGKIPPPTKDAGK